MARDDMSRSLVQPARRAPAAATRQLEPGGAARRERGISLPLSRRPPARARLHSLDGEYTL
eukprot:scaffold136140_cov36-Tisochrysis_lutea.AAC.4